MHSRKHHRNGYVVSASPSGIVEVTRLLPPGFSAFLIRDHDYRPALGEVFLGPPGECLVGLTWESDEPPENIVLDIIGELEAQLSDWRSWPVLDECDMNNVVRINQYRVH